MSKTSKPNKLENVSSSKAIDLYKDLFILR